MTEKDVKNSIEYWKKTAEHDYKAMLALYKSKEYSNSLFFGHIILEKVLKGLYVKENKQHAPFTHDLSFLNKGIESGLSKVEDKFLDEVNNFNIRARYPDVKFKFYKECTKDFTEGKLKEIELIYKKLWEKLEQ
ncbi:hypothetical protein A3C57_01625 [Candidatus Nomurabacteria bacterium RIFCSPHIGHO2_02_FULL_33_12]|uniref:HEPN domain-containing protein n=1 Tax=Candidatus Nomurabacteria bacterium RIFCSPLOWO2_01_FULL_33_17 TaxID=1801764 RepID=A0A1F6WR27_9BACT|nr:MAG: hypothetical protein A3C57_01625 [Candidatus Nomurabacteria bacterium RIFCSPHIGHO2_02_FULL_33_12]OGI84333.1 MAG: hypothetical protein A2903_00505 [Candidatus Nomurabacteria bacterium RIFCSPLOWO2_01_FULL_33_17]